jgi:hypothetical protein
MIVSYILGILLLLVGSLIGLFPAAAPLPAGVAGFFAWFSAGLGGLSALVPVAAILQVLGLIVAVEVAWFTYKAILRIFHMIRG